MPNGDQTAISVIAQAAGAADCVIVVPPFASAMRPALGPHILQTIARAQGMAVRVLYANLIFAAEIGIEDYERICDETNRSSLLGERVFARAAHGLPRLGLRPGEALTSLDVATTAQDPFLLSGAPTPSSLVLPVADIEARTDDFCELVAQSLATSPAPVIGMTSSFEQINAGLALLRLIKRKRPSAVTLIGGANCEGEMAYGIFGLCPESVDFVFSGESEHTFPEALKSLLRGIAPSERVIHGTPCGKMDDIPVPDFGDYFGQLTRLLPSFDQKQCWLAYESSRGCWWGQKHHCTFCGLNGGTMQFREKSPFKVIRDLEVLLSGSPTRQVAMADNIMPHSYHASLVPMLKELEHHPVIFYEQKARAC